MGREKGLRIGRFRKMVRFSQRYKNRLKGWVTTNHPILNDNAQLELSGIYEQPNSSKGRGDGACTSPGFFFS